MWKGWKIHMIVVHLIGGLGNQMFQYATARRLSEIWKVPLKLDVSGYKTDSSNPYPRRYGLGIFKINQDFITQVEINQWIIAKTHRIVRGWFIFITKLKSFKKLQFVWNLIAKLRITQKLVVLFFLTDFLTYRLILEVQEKSINFNPLILFLSKDAYINGFWQSERYFKDIESIIRKEFSFNQKPDIQNKELIDLITSTNSISIHIRRGDYISDPIVRRDFGSLGLSYYKKCIDFISEKVENPHFFIFSDDISWVTKNLKINLNRQVF